MLRSETKQYCFELDVFSQYHGVFCLENLGSPFLVSVGGEPSGRITERIVRQKEAADITHIGSQCELSLKIPGMSVVYVVNLLPSARYQVMFTYENVDVRILSLMEEKSTKSQMKLWRDTVRQERERDGERG